jgi:uncharacterized protein YbbC (DUF1343 family)
MKSLFLILTISIGLSCQSYVNSKSIIAENQIKPAAERMELYLSKLDGMRVGLLINHTSKVGEKHLVDTLLSLGVNIVKIFAPEHGIRGNEDAGAIIKDGKDTKTGIPVISLYGSKKKPEKADLDNLDLVIYDIQDVGVRFFTYLSSLHYMMEACADHGKKLIVLDRPNPNGFYVDGPVLKSGFSSFVGLHPIPVVYGLTIGEMSGMIVGEKWLNTVKPIDISVIPLANYTHDSIYHLPVKPSPNLPDLRAILWYPSVCFFEGTIVSLGRGTAHPFQYIGHPDFPDKSFSFVPQSLPGATSPPLMNQECYGLDLSHEPLDNFISKRKLQLGPLIQMYRGLGNRNDFFLKNLFFDKLAGNDQLRTQLINGVSEQDIRESWQKDIDAYMKKRSKYLLYPDFEH